MARNIKIGLFIFVCVIAASFSFYAWQVFKTPNLQIGENDQEFELYIPKGATYEAVLDTLKKHDVVHDQMSFRFLAKLMKYPQSVKYGRYVIQPKTSNYTAIVKLRSGDQDPVKLTFNSLRLKDDLVKRIGSKLEFGTDTLQALLSDPAVTDRYGFDTTNIVCMFIPNTYEFFWTVKPNDFLDRMAKEYKNFWNAERKQKAAALGLSQTQVQILASIVESETKKKDEQPRVAGVYLNRLKRGIKLEADPTLVFAMRDFTIRRVLNVHKGVNSPYNTYRFAGLPPGPIYLPSESAIDAVLNAESHDYLYFVAKDDFSGYHTFSRTYAEHIANARIYQRALNERKIMK